MKNLCVVFRLALLILILSLVITTLPVVRADTTNLNHNYPRLANYFLKPTLSQGRADSLKKWDLLVLSAEFGYDSSSGLNSIRAQNPNVVLLPYVNTMLLTKQGGYDWDRHYNYLKLLTAEASGSPGWWLYDQYGNKVGTWTNTWNLNLSDVSPIYNGKRWSDYLSDFVHYEVMRDYPWDGIFYDDAHQVISWMNSGNLDLNNDGAKDSSSYLNEHWGNGLTTLFSRSRTNEGTGKIIIGNGGYTLYGYGNGRLFENFPKFWSGATWDSTMKEYFDWMSKGISPQLAIINGNNGNTGDQLSNLKNMRFTLTSTLLGDGYFSYDYGDTSHGQLWWYDEYSVSVSGNATGDDSAKGYFGQPKGAAYKLSNGTWRRDFDYGIVLVNPTSQAQTVNLEKTYKKIKGTQAPKVNDGSLVTTITLPSQDGIILLDPNQGSTPSSLITGITTPTVGGGTIPAVDNTAPAVISTSPADGATGVAVISNVTATFSEDMNASTINISSFTLKDSTHNPVSGAVFYNSATKTATFNHDTELASETTYTATITNGVKDLAGNPLVDGKVWTFTTADVIVPTTTLTTSPSTPDGDSDWFKTIPLITLTSDEPVTTHYSWVAPTDTWTTYSTSFNAPAGENTLYYYSVDTALNTETVKSRLFKVDTGLPTSAITSPSEGAKLNGASYNITGTSSDPASSGVAKVEVSINGGAWNLATGTTSWSYSWTLGADGSYNIKSRATDNAGNQETPGAGVNVVPAPSGRGGGNGSGGGENGSIPGESDRVGHIHGRVVNISGQTISGTAVRAGNIVAPTNSGREFKISDLLTIQEFIPVFPKVPQTVGHIHGRVVNANGQAIPGTAIRAGNFVVPTNPGGEFRISDLPTGAYTVYYDAPGYASQIQEFIPVFENQTTDTPMVIMSPSSTSSGSLTGEIFGKVVNRAGQTIPGTCIRINASLMPTNPGAEFRFTLVYPGIYTIYYDAPGYKGQTQVIEVKAGTATRPPTAIMSR